VRLFELRGISKKFGAIQALTEVDLKIDRRRGARPDG